MKKIMALLLVFMTAFSMMGCQPKATEEPAAANEATEEQATETASEEAAEPAKELTKVTVVLDWVPNTNHTGLYAAKANGFYEEAGLDVEIIQPTEGGTASLIAAGQGEFGISYQEEVTYARTAAEPLPIKAIAAIIQNNTSGFASPVEKGIETPKDFEGKRYGGWGSPAEVAVLKGLMDNEGADFEKLEMVDLGALDFFAATKDHADFTWIYYGWDGVAAELKDAPINFIKLQDFEENLDFYTPVIIANENLIAEDPELVKAFMQATSKGYEFAISSPEEAVEALLTEAPEIDRDIAVASQKYLADEYAKGADRWGEMTEEKWSNYSRWMYEQGLLESELNASEAFTNEFIPE